VADGTDCISDCSCWLVLLVCLCVDIYLRCVVLGNENTGVSLGVRDACTTLLRIDMNPRVDSLSITVAGGILLNGLREREAPGRDW
jgi:hypothetical protein